MNKKRVLLWLFVVLIIAFFIYTIIKWLGTKENDTLKSVYGETEETHQIGKTAVERSSYNMIEAVQNAYIDSLSNGNPLQNNIEYDVTKVSVSGVHPKSGKYLLLEDGSVILKKVVFSDYICNGTKEDLVCEKKID